MARSSFYKILNAITAGEETLFTAVDYVSGVLLNDVVAVLQDVVDMFARNDNEKGKMSDDLSSIRYFSKTAYEDHAIMEGDCMDTHGLEFGLNPKCGAKTSQCSHCYFGKWWFQQMQSIVDSHRDSNIISTDTIEDALTLLKDCQHKLELYRAHRLRVACQQKALAKLEQEIESYTLLHRLIAPIRAILIIDWKMKFESLSARETSQMHYGKRGIGMFKKKNCFIYVHFDIFCFILFFY